MGYVWWCHVPIALLLEGSRPSALYRQQHLVSFESAHVKIRKQFI